MGDGIALKAIFYICRYVLASATVGSGYCLWH